MYAYETSKYLNHQKVYRLAMRTRENQKCASRGTPMAWRLVKKRCACHYHIYEIKYRLSGRVAHVQGDGTGKQLSPTLRSRRFRAFDLVAVPYLLQQLNDICSPRLSNINFSRPKSCRDLKNNIHDLVW
jgi:hypothetical protein